MKLKKKKILKNNLMKADSTPLHAGLISRPASVFMSYSPPCGGQTWWINLYLAHSAAAHALFLSSLLLSFFSNVRPSPPPLLSSKRLYWLYFCNSLSHGQGSEMPAFATISHLPLAPRCSLPRLLARLFFFFISTPSPPPPSFSLTGDLK